MGRGASRLERYLPPNSTNLHQIMLEGPLGFPCEESSILGKIMDSSRRGDPVPLHKVTVNCGISWATHLAAGRIKPLHLREVHLGTAPRVLRIPITTMLRYLLSRFIRYLIILVIVI